MLRLGVTKSVANSRWAGYLLLGLVLPLAACGDDAKEASKSQGKADTKASSTANSERAAKAYDNVKEGHVQLVLTGHVDNKDAPNAVSEGEAHSKDKHIYRPAMATGRGDYLRRGSNAEGPYTFAIYTPAIHESTPDEIVNTFITINLPEGATTGTYSLAAYKDATDDQGQARITGSGYGWTFARDIEGIVDVVELGDYVSASWEFTAHDAQGRETTAYGAVKDLPFSPQVEMRYELTLDEEDKSDRIRAGYGKKDEGLTLYGANPIIYVELPSDITPGEYELHEAADHKVRAWVTEVRRDSVEGLVTVTENGSEYLDVVFEFTGGDEEEVHAKGDFRYVPLELLK